MEESVNQGDVDQVKDYLTDPTVSKLFKKELYEFFKLESKTEQMKAVNTLEKAIEEDPRIAAENISFLYDLIKTESDPDIRLSLARCIGNTVGTEYTNKIAKFDDEIYDLLEQSNSPSVRGYLLKFLTPIVYYNKSANQEAVQIAGDLLNVDQTIVRNQALQYLAAAAQFSVDRVHPYTDSLLIIIKEGLVDEREHALRALRWISAEYPDRVSRSTLEAIVSTGLQSPQQGIRREAARMAANLLVSGHISTDLTEELTKLLSDPDPVVRQEAARSVLVVARHTPSIFENPKLLVEKIQDLDANDLNLAKRYGDQYHESLGNLREQITGDL